MPIKDVDSIYIYINNELFRENSTEIIISQGSLVIIESNSTTLTPQTFHLYKDDVRNDS